MIGRPSPYWMEMTREDEEKERIEGDLEHLRRRRWKADGWENVPLNDIPRRHTCHETRIRVTAPICPSPTRSPRLEVGPPGEPVV